MVLRPVVPSPPPQPTDGSAPAWPAIERMQQQAAAEYWLVSQPDHAALAGALAANFISPDFPSIEPQMARAIEVHDAGWAIFDSEARVTAAPALDGRGKPVSFLEVDPADFLRAWNASIERAESVCPAGGYFVSRHFCALGEGRLSSGVDGPENAARLRGFLSGEAGRQRRLHGQSGKPSGELEDLLRVLQFCDLLSLYLCCGAAEAVEFPQPFARGKVRIRPEKESFSLDPSPFRAAGRPREMLSLGVGARRYPPAAPGGTTTTLAFLLW
jgi:hypothetical protein